MANIVIYPKNIYSKPKYNLLKNNIIKNPETEYSTGLVLDNVDYVKETEVQILNTDGNGTKVSMFSPTNYYLNNYEENGVIPYRSFNFVYNNTYYTYAIVKWSISTDDNDTFIRLLQRVEMSATINSVTGGGPRTGNITGFYKNFNIDELELTFANRNEYYTYDSTTNEGTYAFTYINYTDHIDVYMVLGLVISYANKNDEEIKFKFVFKAGGLIQYKVNYINIKYNNSINSDYTLDTNELISYNVARTILNNVVKKYKEGRKSVTLSVYADNYYDENGVLIYDKTNGDLIRNGDIIKLYEYRNGGYTIVGGNTVRYKVTSSEFEYKGQPIIHLELLEEK